MSDDAMQRIDPHSVLAKYAGEHKEHDGVKQHACYSSHATDLRMLDIRLTDGSHVGLPYHYMTQITLHSPEDMQLQYALCRVSVTGLRLDPIYQALLFGRVGYIAVSPSSPAVAMSEHVTHQGEPCIHGITVVAGDGGDEQV